MNNHSKKINKKLIFNIIFFILLISIWGTSIYYGYFYVKDYIDVKLNTVIEKLNTVEEINSGNFNSVNSQIETLNNEIVNLKNEIIKIQDQIIDLNSYLEDFESYTKEDILIKDTIKEKIKLLSNEIDDLTKNIQILQEAPNVKD